MCKRVNVHKEGKEGKGNGKQKIENRNSQFQRVNVLTCKRVNVLTFQFNRRRFCIFQFAFCIEPLRLTFGSPLKLL